MVSWNWDIDILLTFNSFAEPDRLALWELAGNPIFRGFPVFFAFIALWFFDECSRRRGRMLAGLLAVCLATVISVWTQFQFATHTRPILDPSLHLKIADPRWALGWDRSASFPSDTSTLFFALVMVIFVENRFVGSLCFLWVVLVVALPRVIFGWHYPSDIIGALFLGAGCVVVFNILPFLEALFERALIFVKPRMYFVHALLFVLLADAFNLFQGLQQLGKSLVRRFG